MTTVVHSMPCYVVVYKDHALLGWNKYSSLVCRVGIRWGQLMHLHCSSCYQGVCAGPAVTHSLGTNQLIDRKKEKGYVLSNGPWATCPLFCESADWWEEAHKPWAECISSVCCLDQSQPQMDVLSPWRECSWPDSNTTMMSLQVTASYGTVALKSGLVQQCAISGDVCKQTDKHNDTICTFVISMWNALNTSTWAAYSYKNASIRFKSFP